MRQLGHPCACKYRPTHPKILIFSLSGRQTGNSGSVCGVTLGLRLSAILRYGGANHVSLSRALIALALTSHQKIATKTKKNITKSD